MDQRTETISPSEEPEEHEVEAVSAVMALQHADWLGLALGVVRRGSGAVLDAERMKADIDLLDEIEGEIEDREGVSQDGARVELDVPARQESTKGPASRAIRPKVAHLALVSSRAESISSYGLEDRGETA